MTFLSLALADNPLRNQIGVKSKIGMETGFQASKASQGGERSKDIAQKRPLFGVVTSHAPDMPLKMALG